MYKQTSQKYPQRFQDIYLLSKKLSETQKSNFDEVFNQAVKFHDSQHSQSQIWQYLQEHSFKTASKSTSTSSNRNYDVWLTFGETGQGKSTFTNSICGSQVAIEGKGIKSKTESIGLHVSNKHRIIMIDTPGLFDTRRIRNKEISNQVIEIVQEKLKENAHIKAIFFVWSPTASMRLRFDEILANLKKALGEGAIDSVVFLINKVSHLWNEEYEELYDQFLELMDDNNLTNPVFQCDLKQINEDDVKQLKELAQEVQSFREEDFEAHRLMIYYNKFLEVQRIDEQKKKDRENLEKELGEKFDKRANEMEGKFKKEAEKMEEKFQRDFQKQEAENKERRRRLEDEYQSELNVLKDKGNRLQEEMRQDKERYQRESERRAEEDRKKREESQRLEEKFRNDLLKIEAENAQMNRKLQQQYQEELSQQMERTNQLVRLEQERNRREAEERERRRQEEIAKNYPSQNVNPLSFFLQDIINGELIGTLLKSSTNNSFQSASASDSFLSANDNDSSHVKAGSKSKTTLTQPKPKPESQPSPSTEGKTFYPGGRFIPGPKGTRAPKGGIWI